MDGQIFHFRSVFAALSQLRETTWRPKSRRLWFNPLYGFLLSVFSFLDYLLFCMLMDKLLESDFQIPAKRNPKPISDSGKRTGTHRTRFVAL